MPRGSRRRDELAEAATDYVLEHGLIGLSLRPLADALGTSDRMLLYHFESKDDLVATVLQVSSDRSAAEVRNLPPARGPRRAVLALWEALRAPLLSRCQRAYVEAAALGLFGREPYVRILRQANGVWSDAVASYLMASGAPSTHARRAVELLDAATMGFLLDLHLDADGPARRQAVEDLADAVASIVGETGQGSA